MNLYIRFFNDETLVTNVDDAVEFLNRVTDTPIDQTLYEQLIDYYNSPIPYPRRFKVHSRIYFIVIKTPAETMEEFKERGLQMQEAQKNEKAERMAASAAAKVGLADNDQPGWYDVYITFKRVIFNEIKGKNEYIDTDFEARVKAHNAKESYDRVCSYLMGRDDVDSRSQMPSMRGHNVVIRFLGMQEVGA